MDKQMIFKHIDKQEPVLFEMACQIFDKPECRGKEFFAAGLLAKALEEAGFAVETGVGGEPTAFRAVWKNGEGGPNIGFIGEYDALENLGHGCGHHLQTPAAIGAAIAIKAAFADTATPFTLTIYGTPAEETYGGKIKMAEKGCFQELDVALSTHASRMNAYVSGSSMALNSYIVTYHGKASHAAGIPWEGRSAGDAMFLSFNGVEHMREHVKDGTRLHYTVKEALGPSNIVPERAVAGYSVRSRDTAYLQQLTAWLLDVVKGACLMTQTTCDIVKHANYAAIKKNTLLSGLAKDNFALLAIPTCDELVQNSSGSTDFGNVSSIVPSMLVYLPYTNAPGHSQQWVDAGKTEQAKVCMIQSSKTLAGIAWDLIRNPDLVKQAKEEFDKY